MQINPETLQRLQNMVTWKKGKRFYAEKLGITESEVEELLKKIKDPEDEIKDSDSQFEEDLEKGTAKLSCKVKEEIKNLDDLIEKCNIDTSIWNITKYVQNYWGNSSDPHWQVKAFLSRKSEDKTEILKNLFENFKPKFKPLSGKDLLINKDKKNNSLALISLTDAHLAKQTLDGRDAKSKADKYLETLKNLATKAYKLHKVSEILYIIGSDFSHTDTYQGTTTNYTQQDSSLPWYDAYELEFSTQVEAISILKQFCEKLVVKHIPGNHARTKEYYMAHALELFFKSDPNIEFDRSPESTKAHLFGNTFIGIHHGDTVTEKLPLYFASKYRELWGKAKYTEIALGDKHHRKEWKFTLSQGEVQGARMFMCPSLSSADRWHKDKLYDLAIQAGLCRIYDEELGYVAEFEERINT